MTTFLIIVGLVIVFFLVFCSSCLPNWVCEYLGHIRPKHISVATYDDTKIVGKCSRCGKLVQNDTDYPNDVWY